MLGSFLVVFLLCHHLACLASSTYSQNMIEWWNLTDENYAKVIGGNELVMVAALSEYNTTGTKFFMELCDIAVRSYISMVEESEIGDYVPSVNFARLNISENPILRKLLVLEDRQLGAFMFRHNSQMVNVYLGSVKNEEPFIKWFMDEITCRGRKR